MTDYLDYNNSRVVNNFKTVYKDLLVTPFLNGSPFLQMIKRDPTMKGHTNVHGVRFSEVGGYGAGPKIPDAGAVNTKQASYTAVDLYQRGKLDYRSFKESLGSEAAFEGLLDLQVESMQREFNRNLARQIINGDATGAIGTLDTSAVTDNTGGNYTVLITSASWVRANWRQQQIINFGSSTDTFYVQSVAPATRAVTVQRTSGTYVPVDSDVVYMQGCKNNEMEGLSGILKATSGSKYGITIGDGWKSSQKDAAGKPLTEDMLCDMAYAIYQESGEWPTQMVVGGAQMKKLTHLGNSLKILTYDDLTEKDKNGDNLYKMGSMPHLNLAGQSIPILYDQFMRDSEIFFVNKDYMTLRSHGEGEFLKDEGSGSYIHHALLINSNTYELCYYMLSQMYVIPTFHGIVYGLSTTTNV